MELINMDEIVRMWTARREKPISRQYVNRQATYDKNFPPPATRINGMDRWRVWWRSEIASYLEKRAG